MSRMRVRIPDLFLDNHPRRPLLLDEIQYAPELVAAIKRRVDKDPTPGQFVLTGSQQWEGMKSLAERLGREIGIAPQTARRWLDMLKATFQWFDVPAFSGNKTRPGG